MQLTNLKHLVDLIRSVVFVLEEDSLDDFVEQMANDTANMAMIKFTELLEERKEPNANTNQEVTEVAMQQITEQSSTILQETQAAMDAHQHDATEILKEAVAEMCTAAAPLVNNRAGEVLVAV